MRLLMTRLMKPSLWLLLIYSLVTPALVNSHANLAAQAATDEEATDPQYSMNWRITGPTGGDVRALVIDPSDPQRLYFGTLDGQIYISADGGQQWRMLFNFN